MTENLDLPSQIFQAGAFADDPTSSASMTTVDIVDEGIDTTGVIKLFDQHTYAYSINAKSFTHLQRFRYQYSTCDPTRNAIATLPNLINHQNITVSADDFTVIDYL